MKKELLKLAYVFVFDCDCYIPGKKILTVFFRKIAVNEVAIGCSYCVTLSLDNHITNTELVIVARQPL